MKHIMKHSVLSSKTFLTIGALSVLMISSVTFLNYNRSSGQTKMFQINSGVSICFQRVTQTFTALMIRDFSSEYLTKSFRETTSECVNEVSSLMSGLSLNKSILSSANNLKSDLHWFDQKVTKVLGMAKNEDMDISQSNITRKYSELEDIKSSLETSLLSLSKQSVSSRSIGIIASVLGILSLVLSSFGFYARRRLDGAHLESIEERLGDPEFEKQISSKQIITQVFGQLGLPATSNILQARLSNLETENDRLEDALLQMNSLGNERFSIASPHTVSARDISEFNTSFNTVLDQLQSRAFNNGIILDTDLSDDFRVYANQEGLEQLLLSLMSFAMDSTLSLDENRKVSVRSKSLGGIAYCKVKINNYMFGDEELNILNGKSDGEASHINLVLLREMISDAKATLAVRNKQNSASSKVESEIEVIFERVKEDESLVFQSSLRSSIARSKVRSAPILDTTQTSNVQVVKGSKREIKQYLQARI